MSFPAYLLLPLAAAVLYTVGSIFLKRAFAEGASLRQGFHATNLIVGVIFLPLLVIERQPVDWPALWQPFLAGTTFYAGALFNVSAIRRGDVSLVNPLLGTKVVLVALGSVLLLDQHLGLPLWLGAILAAAGVFMMGGRAFLGRATHRHLLPTIGLALMASVAFALTDLMVGDWARAFGPLAFAVVMVLSVSLYSLLLNPLFLRGDPARTALRTLPRRSIPWLVWGSVIIGGQAILMAIAIGVYADPTGANIVYSSRGVFSVVLMPIIAGLLGISESAHHPAGGRRRIFLARLLGSLLLTAGIVIAILGRATES
ncbi:hypothetical protein BH23VER1_BH23VER1_25540 [soil metagenome]